MTPADRNPLNRLSSLMQALATQPHNTELWCQVGFTYLSLYETREALDTFLAAQQINPHSSEACYGEAIARQQLGDNPSARLALQRAIARNPQDQRLYSAHAYLCAAAGLSPEHTLQAYREWARRFAEPLHPRHRPPINRRSPTDKLRIGYLSADFRQHAIMDFFNPVLRHHNRSRYQLIAFSNGIDDVRTPQIRAQFDYWNDIRGLSDTAVADLIRKRGIDILVDLSGHTEGTRLLALARQPAAVQLSWYGYNGTTGISCLTGRLTDLTMDPPGNEAWSAEPLLRLPSFACFEPPTQAPAVSPPPCLQNGYITLGSLNNAQKISDATLICWAELLLALPTARLLLVGPHAPTANTATQEQLWERLTHLGLPRERVSLLPRQSLDDFLSLGQQIDIALETFPLSGGVTTAQALWMGLPVITLAGTQAFERAAAAVLQAAGYPEWITHNKTEYQTRIIALANNPGQLIASRTTQREHLQRSTLLNHAAHVQALEAIFEACWQAAQSQIQP